MGTAADRRTMARWLLHSTAVVLALVGLGTSTGLALVEVAAMRADMWLLLGLAGVLFWLWPGTWPLWRR